jgi:hypothetical protein
MGRLGRPTGMGRLDRPMGMDRSGRPMGRDRQAQAGTGLDEMPMGGSGLKF